VPIAVVSRSCRLDWDTPFFTAASIRPTVFTVADAPADNVARTAEVADVVVAGESDVDLRRAVDVLGERGARLVLAEGGPTLNGQLASEGLLDELCLTLSPTLVSGDSKRILAGPALPAPQELELRSVCQDESFLFLRFRARR
jgi:riboflavin biosynthesis pyrimidine reductase